MLSTQAGDLLTQILHFISANLKRDVRSKKVGVGIAKFGGRERQGPNHARPLGRRNRPMGQRCRPSKHRGESEKSGSLFLLRRFRENHKTIKQENHNLWSRRHDRPGVVPSPASCLAWLTAGRHSVVQALSLRCAFRRNSARWLEPLDRPLAMRYSLEKRGSPDILMIYMASILRTS